MQAHLRVANHSTLRLRPRTPLSRAPQRSPLGRNPGPLGSLAGHQSKHAPRFHPDVSRRLHHPLELPDRPLPPPLARLILALRVGPLGPTFTTPANGL